MTREERYIDYDERIDRYLRGQMDNQERAAFEQEVDGDKELRQRLVATARLAMGITREGMRNTASFSQSLCWIYLLPWCLRAN